MYEGQLAAAAAVRSALGAIAAAVEDAVPALQRGGRIVYARAGTSGRIGVQDGAELPPTFDWSAIVSCSSSRRRWRRGRCQRRRPPRASPCYMAAIISATDQESSSR